MATVNFSVPDEVKAAFDRTFKADRFYVDMQAVRC